MEAVFFDMDGLLADTEKVWLLVETEVMERLGGEWSHEHQRNLVGGSMERTVDYMIKHSRVPVSPQVLRQWLTEGMTRRLSEGVEAMPGALELLGEVVAAGVPAALVTSSVPEIAGLVLDHIGRAHFSAIVTAGDVTRTKPHPEPYLTAARLLGVDPARCVVLEDSPNGVAAATAAGCAVVAVPSLLPIEPAPGRAVVSSLLDVDLPYLRSLIP
ncbi:HAD family hydrolase [Sinosporangium siamense]|uniref:HAD family hydrolase n=1 Tax=Sinosporangium siamense TaxID=1367973 RepID=UPI00194F9730|nr:HAD family phosphatase [Sinosporangium siamense]